MGTATAMPTTSSARVIRSKVFTFPLLSNSPGVRPSLQLRYCRSSVLAVHTAHLHLSRPEAQKQFPRNRIVAVKLIQHRGFGIERKIATNGNTHLVARKQFARTAKGIGADAKRRMIIRNP